jgi:hypothetical protein
MSWLPRIGSFETMLAFDWGEAEGREFSFTWGPLHLEFTVAWRTRVVEAPSLRCIICDHATNETALMVDDDGKQAIIAVCDGCQQIAEYFGMPGTVKGGAA